MAGYSNPGGAISDVCYVLAHPDMVYPEPNPFELNGTEPNHNCEMCVPAYVIFDFGRTWA